MSYIILKFDDLSQETLESFKKAHELCKKYCALPSFGLIGSSLSDPNDEYVADLKEYGTMVIITQMKSFRHVLISSKRNL